MRVITERVIRALILEHNNNNNFYYASTRLKTGRKSRVRREKFREQKDTKSKKEEEYFLRPKETRAFEFFFLTEQTAKERAKRMDEF